MNTTVSVASVASAVAVAAPSIAADFANRDPIFDLIEAHRRAYAEFDRCCRIDDGSPDAEDATSASSDADYEATIDLLNTKPTTVAGVAALAQHAIDHPKDCWKDIDLGDDGPRRPFMECLVEHIADTLAQPDLATIAAQPIARSAPAVDADPVFAAIAQHRIAKKAEDGNGGPRTDDELDAAMDAEWEALTRFLTTTPTTAEGCSAALRYLEEYAGAIDMKPILGDYVTLHASDAFLSMIATAIDQLGSPRSA